MALKLLNRLTKSCSGLHTANVVDIPQVIKTLFSDADGIPQYINAMKAAQRKSKRETFVIHDKYMHAVALKLLTQSGEYETETGEWSKLPEDPKFGRRGRRPSGRLTLRNDALKLPGRGKKNPLVFPPYLVLHQKRKQTNNYWGENIKKQRGQPCSQIRWWTRWRDT